MTALDSLLDKGIRAFNQGKTRASLSYFERALRLDPKDARAKYFKTFALLQDRGTGSAKAPAPPDPAVRSVLEAEARAARGDLDGAASLLRRGLARKGIPAPVLLRWAGLAETLGLYEEAAGCFARSLRDRPSGEGWRGLGRLELWRGRAAAARRCARKALELEPSDRTAMRLRAGAASLDRRWADAERDLDAVLARDPGDAEARLWKAEGLLRRGRADAALAQIAQARNEWPMSVPALILQELCYAALGRPLDIDEHATIMSRVPREIAPMKRAYTAEQPEIPVRLLERALKSYGGNRSITTAFLWKGRLVRHVHYFPRDPLVALQTALRFGDDRVVLRQFRKIVRETPEEAYVYSHRGEVFLWTGRYREALRDFRRARDLNSYLLWPKVGLAAAHLMLGELAEALELIEYAATHGGSDSIVIVWRGETLRRLGRFEEALAQFEKWTLPMPFRPALWLNKALTLEALGRAKEAAGIVAGLRRRLPGFARELAGLGTKSFCERGLELMRGNRSSWMYTYYDREGRLGVMRMRGVDAADVPPGLRGNSWAFEDPR